MRNLGATHHHFTDAEITRANELDANPTNEREYRVGFLLKKISLLPVGAFLFLNARDALEGEPFDASWRRFGLLGAGVLGSFAGSYLMAGPIQNTIDTLEQDRQSD